MATTLPVGINFRLPDGWQAAPPDEVGEPDMAFVAIHPAAGANITISGALRPGATPLTEAAEESLTDLRRSCSVVQVVERRELDPSGPDGLTQVLKLGLDRDGTTARLVQVQVFLAFADIHDPGRRAMVRFALTTTPDRFDGPVDDFRDFIRTIRPADPEPRAAG